MHSADLIEPTFAKNYTNYGADEEQLLQLSGMKAVCLPILSNVLQEYAVQLHRFKSDKWSQAYEAILGYILSVLYFQVTPYNSLQKPGSPQYILILEQLVPPENPIAPWSASNAPVIQGYRLWVFYHELHNNNTWGAYLKAYFHYNYLRGRDTKYADVMPGEINYKLLMNIDDWIRCMEIKNLLAYSRRGDTIRGLELDSLLNPVNPELALDLYSAMLPNSTNIDPRQRDSTNYIRSLPGDDQNSIVKYSFPIPSRCKRYTHDQLKDFLRLQLPVVEEEENLMTNPVANSNFDALIEHLRQLGMTKIEEDGCEVMDEEKYAIHQRSLNDKAREYAYVHINSAVTDMFRSTIGISTNRFDKRNHLYFIELHHGQKAEILRKHKKKCLSPEYKLMTHGQRQKMLRQDMIPFWAECAKHFAYIWTTINEEQSPAKKACITWYQKHRTNDHDRMTQPFSKMSSNLSLWGDFLCWVANNLEHVYKVSVSHMQIINLMLCTWNASDPNRSQKFNSLNFGAAAKSKSYSTNVACEWSIPGRSHKHDLSPLSISLFLSVFTFLYRL
jgi:hypothetical protein